MRYWMLILVIFICSFASVAGAAIYSWKDDKGIVHFTDNPETIPSKYMNRIIKRAAPPEVKPAAGADGKVVSPPDDGKPGDNSETAADAKDESWWREAVGSIKTEMEGLRSALPEKQGKLEVLRRRWRIFRGGAEDRTAYYNMKGEIEKDELRIKELEDQLEALRRKARDAGVPSGWTD